MATSKDGKDIVAIYHFTTANTYSYDYAIGVGNAIEAGFVRSNRFTVVERSRFGSLSAEERFKEANTSEIVGKAAKLGAKIIVTGHIVGISTGDLVNTSNQATGMKFAEISLSFKIIDVESGEIKLSELVRGKGEGGTPAEAIQNAYISIDKLARANIGAFLPQRFQYMSTVSMTTHKKKEYLDKFKIWGGSDHGLKVGDALEIYQLTTLVNPNNNKEVEEKKLIARATILEINSGTTATCGIINTADASKFNPAILDAVSNNQKNIAIEYKGNWYVKPKSIWDRLSN